MTFFKRKLLSIATSSALLISLLGSFAGTASAATITVGAGSYTNTLPPGATAPTGTIYKTANVTGAVPTNDWWSSLAWTQYSENMFPHPLNMKAGATGLTFGYPIQSGSADAIFGAFATDITLGHTATSTFPDTRLDGHSDWTVSMLWNNGAGATMRATSGHGLPFIYSTYAGGTPKLTFSATPTIWSGSASTNVLGVTVNGHHYGLFGPTGSTWTGIGSATLTNSLGGKNYFSVAVLPDNTAATLNTFKTYAYSFVTNTQSNFSYDAASSTVNTTYNVTTQAMEGTQSGTILALYPHQWKNTTTPLLSYTYDSVRGTMKTVAGSSYTTAMKFQGVLPYLPAVGSYNSATLNSYMESVRTEANHTINNGQDTYWLGKSLGRIANLLPIAQQVGNTAAASNFQSYLETTLADHLTAGTKTTNLFYYDNNWGTLIGYPASYGSDTSLNDHHFHYGYWVRAAAEIARNNPNWATQTQYGGMIDLLVKDIANWDRTDSRFPYLRNFDPYAGHSWASGDSIFADGNNNESSSEGINAWVGLILWGQATGNNTIRDLGIYLYTTETTAVNEYWFNTNNTNFKAGYNHNYSSMIWGGKSVYATWFSADPQQIRGINVLPVTAGSMYLGNNPTYSSSFINQLKTERGNNNWSIWADVLWEYQAMYDAPGAISLFNANPGYTPEEGESKAHTYSFLYNMQGLGQVDTSVTANVPTYAVYKNGTTRNYVAYNAGGAAITVTFSDGKTLSVPAKSVASSLGPVVPPASPSISSLNPTSGAAGTSVTISGSNFGATQGTSTVKFGATTATVTAWSATSITATVPSGLAAGAANVTVSVGGVSSNSAAFTVTGGGGTAPAISSLNPTSGAVGTSVTIAGSNFGATQGTSTVKFGATTATVTAWSATSITATVPSGLAAGAANVTVTVGGVASNAAAFTVTTTPPPSGDFTQSAAALNSNTLQITFTPTAASSYVILHYSSPALFGGAQQNVNMTASGAAWTYNITPIAAGNNVTYWFTYTKNGLQQPDSAQFSYTFGGGGGGTTPPSITSLNPTSGPAGTSVTIAGANFGATQGTSTVKFGATTATVTAWSATSITATVPSGLAAGAANVTVTVGGTASNASAFTVTTTAPPGLTSNVLFARSPGVLSFTAGAGATNDTIAAAAGNYDGVPHSFNTYTVSGINATYDSLKATAFNLFVDAGTDVGDAVQVQVIYDFKGDGTQLRTETYNYFATNNVAGFENYTQASGLKSATGTFANMTNGKVSIKVWNAIGTTSTLLRVNATSANGSQSTVAIPFK